MSVSEKEVQKELREHPWATREIAERIARDHKIRKTTTREGKRLYQREYMRFRRQQKTQQLPSLLSVIGLKMPRRRKK